MILDNKNKDNDKNKGSDKKPSPPLKPKKLNRDSWTNWMDQTAKMYD